jgi:hypothetical protein
MPVLLHFLFSLFNPNPSPNQKPTPGLTTEHAYGWVKLIMDIGLSIVNNDKNCATTLP